MATKGRANRVVTPPRSVLVIEDHSVARDALKHLIELSGYDVAAVANGRAALGLLQRGLQPCLILLDVSMRRQGAYRFRREQLKDPRCATIPLVAYSGLYDPTIAAKRLQATAYFQTPFDVERLLKVVDAHCHPRRAAA